MRIELFIPCTPAGQPRAKATSFGGKARMYDPQTIGKGIDKRPHPAVEFRYAVSTAVREAWNAGPSDRPFRVDSVFVFARPKSKTFKSKPNPPLWHMSKPDRDNLDKSVLDCLTGIVWADDSQVVAGSLEKRTGVPGEQSGLMLTIEELESEVFDG